MQYRGYTIEKAYHGYDFYKTSQGVDCEWTGDSWKSNVSWANSIDDAKQEIDDIIYETEETQFL